MTKAAAKISIEDLSRKLADLSVPEEELARYFELDEERSTPTRPTLKLNADTVQVPPASDTAGRARSAQLLNSANYISKLRREARYQAMVNSGTYQGPLIAAEGDSWFQYPILLKDVIDCVFDDYAVFCRSEAGDTLDNMVRRKEYLDALERTGGRLLLLSGGGNDLVAGGELAQHLRPFDPALAPAEYLLPSFNGVLDAAMANIERIVRDVGRAFTGASVICHGYDYAVPANGKWLGKPMKSRGIKDASLQKDIATVMVDRLNTRLRTLANQSPRLSYVDCRGVVGAGRWHDELHPTNAGYADVAARIEAEIKRLLGTRAAPSTKRAAAAAAAAPRARSRARSATRPEAAVAKGYSLHVGLNLVSADHYEGWDGALNACVFDANDMAGLAASLGYDTKLLLDEKATREAVIGAIKATAARMKAGDIFLFSYSGHGGQVPDYSADEAQDIADDILDETLCLFDGQLLDDELYVLWADFPRDSRVLVLSDCCHSGTNIKARMADEMLSGNPPPGERPRLMPQGIAAKVARRHRAFYQDISAQAAAHWAGPVTREMALPVAASVRLISGCQDNQVSLDGLDNGLFTGKLLAVWGEGAFQGNYAAFHRQIAAQMPPSQTPNHFFVGQPSPAFDAQRPFDI
jgi:lysophospholipase L1-like esterase